MGFAAEAVVPSGWRGGVTASCPFVFVHGAGADAGRFRRLGERVKNRVAIDLPGHGEAEGPALEHVADMAAAVARLLSREGWEAPILVGHSMGGAVALALALDLREAAAERSVRPAPQSRPAVAGLGLLGTALRLRVAPAISEALAAGRLPDPFLTFLYGKGAQPEDVDLEAESLTRAVRSGVLRTDMQACDAFDVVGRTGEVRLPATVVTGTQDRMTPPVQARQLADWFADPGLVDLRLIEGSGHYVMLENPDETAAALLALRERVAAGAGAGRFVP